MKYLARKMTPLLMGTLLSAPALFSTTLLFLENFDNNDNGWNSTGVGHTFGTDPGVSEQSVAYASTADSGSATSKLTFTNSVSIIDESLTLDFSVRVDKTADSSSHNLFRVTLGEVGSDNRSITFDIRPGIHAARVYYKRPDLNNIPEGESAWIFNNGSAYTYPNDSEFVNFRLTLIDNGDSTLDAQGFKRDSEDSDDWVSLVGSSTMTYQTGDFDEISIYSYNNSGSTDNRVYFDYVKITSNAVPEPGNFALIVGVLGMSFVLLRRPRA